MPSSPVPRRGLLLVASLTAVCLAAAGAVVSLRSADGHTSAGAPTGGAPWTADPTRSAPSRSAATSSAPTAGTSPDGPSASASREGAGPRAEGAPIRPALHSVALPVGRRGAAPRLEAREVRRFSYVGLTWSDSRTRLSAPVQVRARSAAAHRWGSWIDLTPSDDGPDVAGATRGGTAGEWVGDSDGIEWRVHGVLAAPLPDGARLDLVDPGRPAAQALPRMEPAAFVVAPSPGVPQMRTSPVRTSAGDVATPAPPSMVSRAEWGADESLRRQAPSYAGEVKAVFVHHTVSSNTYSCNDSASLIRSMYAYHTLGQGWNDLGYNFVVDRCGTVFEGRYGGAARPVIGAHTLGFNTDTTGIAVMGTFTSAGASPEVLVAVARVAAWKLSLDGAGPNELTTLTAGATDNRFTAGQGYTFDTISGHRDGYATECPGAALYAQLPTIRVLAAGEAARLGPQITVTGATAMGDRYFTTGKIGLRWTAAVPASDVTGYSVLVDGKAVATTDPMTRTAALALTPGSHRVALRVSFQDSTPGPSSSSSSGSSSGPMASPTTSPVTSPTPGSTPGSTPGPTPGPTVELPTSATVTLTVVADVRPPVFTSKPTLGLRSGTVNATGIPVVVGWRVKDDNQLSKVSATAPTTARFATTSTNWSTVAAPGPRTYALTAVDAAGNSVSASTSGRASLVSETSAGRTGSWARAVHDSHDGGSALFTAAKGASLTWTVTGRSVALVATRTKWSGQARVYLDGVSVGLVDLKGDFTAYRQAVWVRNGLTPGPHTVRLVVVGTAGRPTVIADGAVAVA
jgi:hypothetical protein